VFASEDRVVLDTLLENLLMFTWAVIDVFLPNACEAESRCGCACLGAELSYPFARHHEVISVVMVWALVLEAYVAT
jgi:hypothetical protein